MIDFLRNYAWSIWLGISLGIVGITFDQWQYYLVVVPTIFLVVFRKK